MVKEEGLLLMVNSLLLWGTVLKECLGSLRGNGGLIVTSVFF